MCIYLPPLLDAFKSAGYDRLCPIGRMLNDSLYNAPGTYLEMMTNYGDGQCQDNMHDNSIILDGS